MALLTTVSSIKAGTLITFSNAAAGGDTIRPSGDTYLHVNNTGASACVVTIAVPGNEAWGPAKPDVSLSVPAGGYAIFGPIDSIFRDPADGYAHVTYSQVTDVKVKAVR